MQVLDAGRIGIAALSVGLAQGAYDGRACATRQERRAFGKTISDVSGDPVEAGRHRHPHRGGAPPDLSRRRSRRIGGARTTLASAHGQAVFQRDRRAGSRRLRADSRRLRLREGLPGREVLPRREADDDRRGHERDSAPRHCAAAAGRDERRPTSGRARCCWAVHGADRAGRSRSSRDEDRAGRGARRPALRADGPRLRRRRDRPARRAARARSSIGSSRIVRADGRPSA